MPSTVDDHGMPPGAGTGAPPGWRRIALRTAGICGAALAAQVPPIVILLWPMAVGDLLPLFGNLLIDYGRVGLVVAVSLQAFEHRAQGPVRWRRLLLLAGLLCAVATQLLPDTAREFVGDDSAYLARLDRAGVAADGHAVRLYQIWFSVILVSVSAIYLTQRRESIEAEKRRQALEAQWRQARRRVRIMRDTAGTARLDPQVLFDCLGMARSEYRRNAASGDALLDGLIDFLRGSLSATRPGPHTLGLEVAMTVRFAAIAAGTQGLRVVDAVPAELRDVKVSPGLLLPLVQQWLGACPQAAGGPLCIHASLAGKGARLLCLSLSGPPVSADALLAGSRARLADLYGTRAVARATLAEGADPPRLDIRIQFPRGDTHAA